MRLICHLRHIRGRRPLAEIAAEAGVNRGELSKIENGRALPYDKWIPALEQAYGAPRDQWYSPLGLLAIQEDPAEDEH